MRNAVLIMLALSIAIGGTLMATAQRGGEGFGFGPKHGRGPGMGGPGFGGPMFDRLAAEVGATDEQKAKIKAILDESKTRFEALMDSAKANHQDIENLGTDGVYNEEAVAKIAAQQAELTRQTIIEEKTKAAVFAVLTAEQRAKALELRETFKERMKDRFEGFKGQQKTTKQ